MAQLLDIETAARYNAWANSRIYTALGRLSNSERKADRKAFFGSIHNTMNHILLADLIYRERLEKKPTTYTSLDEVLYDNFADLVAAHRTCDAWYTEFCAAMTQSELDANLTFTAVGMDQEEIFSLPMKLCLTNLFQHQIHHRGQVHQMISETGQYPPPVDVVKFGRGDVDGWSDPEWTAGQKMC